MASTQRSALPCIRVMVIGTAKVNPSSRALLRGWYVSRLPLRCV